jgi:hypothetical protein
MFDAATLADVLHRYPFGHLPILADLIEEQPEDPFARAALAEANRLLDGCSPYFRLSSSFDEPAQVKDLILILLKMDDWMEQERV